MYRIYFDTGKSDVKPESGAALKEIAKLLAAQPALKLWIVGHNDSQGVPEQNIVWSRERGEAVVKVLTTRYASAACVCAVKAVVRWRLSPRTRLKKVAPRTDASSW